MSREDYQAISKIIEEVVGRDTLTGVKLLEGIRFYINNKVEKVRIIRDDTSIKTTKESLVSAFKEDADNAMKKYTAKLKKESNKYRKRKKSEVCSISEWE